MSRLPEPFYDEGGITIYHGDCREILPHLEPGVDLIVTDPPYAISVAGATHTGQPGKGARRLDFFKGDDDWASMTETWRKALELGVALLAPHGSVYAWLGHRQFGVTIGQLESSGFKTRFLGWVKKCPVPPPPGGGWPSALELCVYGYRDGRRWTHTASTVPYANVFTADSYRFGQPGKVDHPTQKPPEVITPLITASSNMGDLILDPFMGSGTTLRVAKDMGRRAIGIELERKYCDIAVARLSQGVLLPC